MEQKYIAILDLEKLLHFKDSRHHIWFKWYIRKVSNANEILNCFEKGLLLSIYEICINSHYISYDINWLSNHMAIGEDKGKIEPAIQKFVRLKYICTGTLSEIEAQQLAVKANKPVKLQKEYNPKTLRDRLILCHKVLLGIPAHDIEAQRSWDKHNYKKEIEPADELLVVFKNDIELLKEYISGKVKEYQQAGIKDWTMRAYLRSAVVWLQRRKKHEN